VPRQSEKERARAKEGYAKEMLERKKTRAQRPWQCTSDDEWQM